MGDPRLTLIKSRFKKVGRVIAVSSGKGGVGKSLVATCFALRLKEQGYKVGLFDLDFTSPATHVILGVEGLYPREDYGIIPPLAFDIQYMSITHYSLDEPAPLRGEDVSNAIIELLAITRWGELDYLIVDMPPGIGDATLDTIRLIPRLEFIIVTTPSKVAYQSVRRMILFLIGLGIPISGLIENMVMSESDYVITDIENLNLNFLGKIDYDEGLEAALGDVPKLSKTIFYEKIGEIISMII
jgi:ATP-binding protein involved in chromosome partitioning